MQQTRIDRWLRERFVYETHIYSMRPAGKLPSGVKTRELPPAPGRQYAIHYIVRNKAKAKILIQRLKDDGQIFTTRVVDRGTWFVPFIAPQGRSFSWRIIWSCFFIGSVLAAAYGATKAWENDTLRNRVLESIEIMKG
jgi:hypothetical protein